MLDDLDDSQSFDPSFISNTSNFSSSLVDSNYQSQFIDYRIQTGDNVPCSFNYPATYALTVRTCIHKAVFSIPNKTLKFFKVILTTICSIYILLVFSCLNLSRQFYSTRWSIKLKNFQTCQLAAKIGLNHLAQYNHQFTNHHRIRAVYSRLLQIWEIWSGQLSWYRLKLTQKRFLLSRRINKCKIYFSLCLLVFWTIFLVDFPQMMPLQYAIVLFLLSNILYTLRMLDYQNLTLNQLSG